MMTLNSGFMTHNIYGQLIPIGTKIKFSWIMKT